MQLLFGLTVDIVIHLFQQFTLQPGDLLRIVFSGQRGQRNAEGAEGVFRLGQRVVGGLENSVDDLPRTVHQLRVMVGQLGDAVQQFLRALVQTDPRVGDFIRLRSQRR